MLVFGTQMHIVTFFFVSVEIVILLYLVIIRLARPADRTVLLNMVLIFLLLVYNISSGLLPDPKLPGSLFSQLAVAYAAGFITPCYFPYYVYKAFNLERLKFQAYVGVYLFLIIPLIIFVAVFAWTKDLKVAQIVFIIPMLYGFWIINLLFRSIRYKYNNNLNSKESKQELIVLLLSISPWVSLPVIDVLNLGQATETSITNFGFLLLFSLQVKRNIKQFRIDHEKLIDSENKLRSLNTNLQEKVLKRTKELEEANQLKTRNFINLVHETKTPLTLIKNYLDEYINKYGSAAELDIIKSGIDKLAEDVINLFDIERFSKGIDVYRHNKISNFSEILNKSLPLFKYYCDKQSISLQIFIEEDLLIKADPNALNRIVNNIIENAIKFTEAGGKIAISLSQLNDKIVFSVQDDGIGIPLSQHKKIFEPYYQIGNKNTSLQGMGLGLPIVKKVVDSLNGTIEIESNPRQGPGTKVVITLAKHDLKTEDSPAQFVNEPKASYYQLTDFKTDDSEYSPDRHTILLVEDNKAMLNFLITKLRKKYNIYSALNGAEGIKKLHELPVVPDLILSDIMMDKMDGFSFAKIISEQSRYNHIPFVFLTAKSTSTDRMKGLKLGAIDFVSKPFSFEELNQKIETILLNVSKQQEAILKSSISSLKTQKQLKTEFTSVTLNSKFDQNCRLYILTPRETEVARLIVKGNTYKEIANELFISEKTVTKHIQNIFGKAGVSNKVELINKLIY
jgi:signal transduction histidine kinase/DNA-binding NarL/FixJ family response regulator